MITDERLKQRAESAITLQQEGHFIIDYRKELPTLSLDGLQYTHERDEHGHYFDFETPWGKFSYAPNDRDLLVLRKGTPPAELMPQPHLELATATIHTGYACINNNGSSFDLDFQTRDRFGWETIRLINQNLAAEQLPVVAWQADQAEEKVPPIIRITNDSAMLFASSAIWDEDEQQLVATQVVTTSQDLLKAIKATLANNNNKSYLTVKTPDDNAYLKGARRGFVTVSNNLTQANAEGTVTALLHPLSGDPQPNSSEHFYVVVSPEEEIAKKFIERLELAIPWPLQPEWTAYLLEEWEKSGLVQLLPSVGSDFIAGLRVLKNESKWGQVITKGLRTHRIVIP
jgi:hypothetical protein